MSPIAPIDPGCIDMGGLKNLRPGSVFYSHSYTYKRSTLVIEVTTEPKASAETKDIAKPKSTAEPKDTGEPAFFLGSESVKNLRKYVDAGLILPKSREEFEAQHLKAPMDRILREAGFPDLYEEVCTTATILSLHCRDFDTKTLVYISDLGSTIACFARDASRRLEDLDDRLTALTPRNLEFNDETKDLVDDVLFYLNEILELCRKHGPECKRVRAELGEFRVETLCDQKRLNDAMSKLNEAKPKINMTIKEWQEKPPHEAEKPSSAVSWLMSKLRFTGKDELKEIRKGLLQGLPNQLGPFLEMLAPAHDTVELAQAAMEKMSGLFSNMENGIKDTKNQFDKASRDISNMNFRIRGSAVKDVKDTAKEWREVERAARSFQERE